MLSMTRPNIFPYQRLIMDPRTVRQSHRLSCWVKQILFPDFLISSSDFWSKSRRIRCRRRIESVISISIFPSFGLDFSKSLFTISWNRGTSLKGFFGDSIVSYDTYIVIIYESSQKPASTLSRRSAWRIFSSFFATSSAWFVKAWTKSTPLLRARPIINPSSKLFIAFSALRTRIPFICRLTFIGFKLWVYRKWPSGSCQPEVTTGGLTF